MINMNPNFYTFIVGLEISVVVIGLFGIFSLSSFDRGKNKWLILAFVGIVWPWLNLLLGVNRFEIIPYSGFLQNPASFIIFSPALYFFTYELVNPGCRGKNKKLLINLFFFTGFYIFIALNGIGDPYQLEKSENLLSLYVLIGSITTVTLYYSFLTVKLVKINRRKLENEFSDTNPYISLDWIIWLIWAIFSMPIIGGISTLVSLHTEEGPAELFVLLSQLFFCGCVIYFSLRQPVIYQTEAVFDKETEPSKSELSSISYIALSEKEKAIYVDQIEACMVQEKPYLNSKIRMPELAKDLKIPRHIFSYVINEHFQMNFFRFINQYRVEYAKTLLEEGRHRDYTLEAISKMSGFNSKSTFNARFKEIAGMNPKQYQQSIS